MADILEVPLTSEQRVLFAPILRLQHELADSKLRLGIFAVVSDSYIYSEGSGVLRLQVAVLDWPVAEKILKEIAKNAIPVPVELSAF